jgi:hypothetical protein
MRDLFYTMIVLSAPPSDCALDIYLTTATSSVAITAPWLLLSTFHFRAASQGYWISTETIATEKGCKTDQAIGPSAH